MGQKSRPKERDGRVVTNRAGARWLAQLALDEWSDGQAEALLIDVPGTFASEETAARAARTLLAEWRAGRVTLHDLVLRELAAMYRRLRETHQPMEPVAVPTTDAAWERAIALWELAGWLDAGEAVRYREHARRAFAAAAARVKRHRLADGDAEPAT